MSMIQCTIKYPVKDEFGLPVFNMLNVSSLVKSGPIYYTFLITSTTSMWLIITVEKNI